MSKGQRSRSLGTKM